MKPERRVAVDVELNDAEKAQLKMIEAQSPVLLNELKTQSGLSNKQWDKIIKGLTKNKSFDYLIISISQIIADCSI